MKQLTGIFAIIVAVLCLVLLPKKSRAQSCKTNNNKKKNSEKRKGKILLKLKKRPFLYSKPSIEMVICILIHPLYLFIESIS